MPSCCIKKCGARKNINHPTLTLHKFPADEILKRIWLEAIGIENINPQHKIWYVCSLHFEDTCFNRTLDVARLRDGSVPRFSPQNPDQSEEMEEGQEEWLSEGVLTDDDYNAAADQEQSDYANMSQEDTMASVNDSMDNHNIYHDTGDSNAQDGHERDQEENIEEALNNLENSQDKDFPDELGAFLIRKTDSRMQPKEQKEVKQERRENEVESERQTDDDGHDTDELLRMLGEDGVKSKKKHVLRLVKEKRGEETSEDEEDDDEYIFEGAKVTRLKMAKNAFIKKYPTKAVPEEMSDKEDSEASQDEALTVKSMFGVGRRPGSNVASKSTTIGGINALQTVTKRVVSLDGGVERHPLLGSQRQMVVKQVRGPGRPPKPRPEPEEAIHEEFLEEGIDLDQEIESEGEVAVQRESRKRVHQQIMRPEQMDEEVPTDGESQSEEDSLYDEMPSSESEDLDEWFTLDIRAERAGDYIPLLGENARQLLSTERKRVGARLATLRQSLSALTESGRLQSEQLRKATSTLAELDAALKAT